MFMKTISLFFCHSFQRLKHIDYDLCFILEAAGTGAANLFLFCFFGYLATESFERMANSFYESNWQLLPIELQKYILLTIRNMQKPFHYHGFGLVPLNLETFCKVSFIAEWFILIKLKWLFYEWIQEKWFFRKNQPHLNLNFSIADASRGIFLLYDV